MRLIGRNFLAKVAVALEQALTQRAMTGAAGSTERRILAQGAGWIVSDVICTSGPRDRAFEERHSWLSIAVVAAGTFQYRCGTGSELMIPGSLLLGNPGDCFECGHEHGSGDRCIAFHYAPDTWEELMEGMARPLRGFRVPRIPPQQALSATIARVCAGLTSSIAPPWEELSAQLAGNAVELASGASSSTGNITPGVLARVTRVAREIERHPEVAFSLLDLAREARLSRYHFLRTFERLTGVTPHQYVRRARLREAALRLLDSQERVLELALDCGFGDVSSFNRCFRAEFGASPQEYRRKFSSLR